MKVPDRFWPYPLQGCGEFENQVKRFLNETRKVSDQLPESWPFELFNGFMDSFGKFCVNYYTKGE